jgi:hypothetical protein
MTVSSQNPRNQYVGNGSQTTFSYLFEIITDSDIAVYVDENLKTLATDYTVTGAGVGAGGTVVFTTAPANGAIVTFCRSISYQRVVDYVTGGSFYASDVNADIDRVVLGQQQLQEQINRTFRLDAGSAYQGENTLVAVSASERANSYLGFDTAGNLTTVAPTPGKWRGNWATGTVYESNDIIIDGPTGDNTLDIYVCVIGNTSGTWSADLAAGKWALAINVAAVVAAVGNATLTGNNAFTGTNTFPTQASGDNSTKVATDEFVARAIALRGYIDGLTLSTAGSSSTFGIAAGMACDSSAAWMMTLANAYTKTTAAWAVGSGNGSLDTGTIANSTWYHVYLIRRPDTGVVDVLISLSATTPTLPASYIQHRRIGVMKTDSSAHWTAFFQNGDDFWWSIPTVDINANTTTSATLYTVNVPTGVSVTYRCSLRMGVSSIANTILLTSPLMADTAPAANGPISAAINMANSDVANGMHSILTNTSAQIRSRATLAGVGHIITGFGWIDLRGRDS